MTPFRLLLLALAPVLSLSGPGADLFGDDLVGDAIRARVEAYRPSEAFVVAGDTVAQPGPVVRFYMERSHRPAWTADLEVLARADSVIAAVRSADLDGLTPAEYHAGALEALVVRARSGRAAPGVLADLELLVTDAFVRYGRHLAEGRTDPRAVDPEWRTALRGTDVEAVLRRAVLDDDPALLRALAPAAPEYRRLKALLVRVRTVAARGGWDSVPAGGTLRPGDRDPRVAAVRARLREESAVHPASPDPGGAPDRSASDDPGGAPDQNDADAPDAPAAADADLFDDRLEEAVRDFQDRHGLAVDGAVGERTLAALNVPVSSRIPRIRANLERWRWLPETLGERYVRVNIAAFTVDVMEGGRSALHMRAVVGQNYRETPIFSDRIEYLVFSPYWNVPPGIAGMDKLPEIRRDPSWLDRQGMTLFAAGTGRRVDPASVEWAGMTAAEFNRRFWLRQDPGPLNALGGVKFMFPNRYNVYLHDTPERWLFGRSVRDFSSGCIRVEKPVELARWLLGAEWDERRIRAAMARGREERVDLAEKVPVHVLYLTATVDGEGRPYLFDDVYGRDARILVALDGGPEPALVQPVGG